MTRLKILSCNIHKGFSARGARGLRFTLPAFRKAIQKLHPDVIFLQEVHGRLETQQPQFEYLAHGLWPHYAYGKNAVYARGHHGNAILSKFPIDSYENIDISLSRFERRGILHTTLLVPSAHGQVRLHALCTHLDLMERQRKKQLEMIARRIESHVPPHEPVLAAGDFNDWRIRATSFFERRLGLDEAFQSVHGKHPRTFPSWRPALRLDRIYYRGLEAESATKLDDREWRHLSDHLALFAEINLI